MEQYWEISFKLRILVPEIYYDSNVGYALIFYKKSTNKVDYYIVKSIFYTIHKNIDFVAHNPK